MIAEFVTWRSSQSVYTGDGRRWETFHAGLEVEVAKEPSAWLRCQGA